MLADPFEFLKKAIDELDARQGERQKNKEAHNRTAGERRAAVQKTLRDVVEPALRQVAKLLNDGKVKSTLRVDLEQKDEVVLEIWGRDAAPVAASGQGVQIRFSYAAPFREKKIEVYTAQPGSAGPRGDHKLEEVTQGWVLKTTSDFVASVLSQM